MVIIGIQGGLGNQMFQYAFGRLLASRGKKVCYELDGLSRGCTPREFGLDAFAIREFWWRGVCYRWLLLVWRWMGRFRLIRELRWLTEDPESVYNASLLDVDDVHLIGCFQVARYCQEIRPLLLSAFVLKRSPGAEYDGYLAKIRASMSVSVHVRRGDYVSLSEIYTNCSSAYYEHAAAYLNGKVARPVYFIFSDDLAWAREHLVFPGEKVFVEFPDRNDAAVEMMLMRSCRHHIIANSTYSWWGAWLGWHADSVIIAPACWFADGRRTDIVPSEWIRM